MLAYVSAKKKILQFIRDEGVIAGARLPTEVELSEKLDIGRLTLREALNALKNEGVVYSVQGKGTFVACNYEMIADSLNVNSSVSEMIELGGYKPGVAYFEKRLIKADENVAKALQLAPGVDVLMCARIRLADDVPVVHSSDYLSPQLATKFLGITDETVSLYSFIEEQCGIAIGFSITEIIPAIADEHMARLLDVPVNSPLLKFIATVNDTYGTPLIYAIEYFRPDKFNFIVTRGR